MTATSSRQAAKRQRTRDALLDAAARVFAERGYHAATLEEVADAAGYSKGALTYNWAGKEALFLDLLEHRLTERAEQIRSAAHTVRGGGADALRHAVQQLPFDREWSLLFLELTVHAARRPDLRKRFVERLEALRQETAAALGGLDADLPQSTHDLAIGLSALANGLSIEALLHPSDEPPSALFAELLGTLLRER